MQEAPVRCMAATLWQVLVRNRAGRPPLLQQPWHGSSCAHPHAAPDADLFHSPLQDEVCGRHGAAQGPGARGADWWRRSLRRRGHGYQGPCVQERAAVRRQHWQHALLSGFQHRGLARRWWQAQGRAAPELLRASSRPQHCCAVPPGCMAWGPTFASFAWLCLLILLLSPSATHPACCLSFACQLNFPYSSLSRETAL